MCRLALFNRQFASETNKSFFIRYFTFLDTRLGGNGMGLYLHSSRPILVKGVKTKPHTLAALLYKMEWEYAIFHCRLTACGSTCDENCHPFIVGDLVLAHNGVAQEFAGSELGLSDTLILAHVINDFAIPWKHLDRFTGVFVGMYKDTPFVVKPSAYTDLEIAYSYKTGGFLIGSEMITDIDNLDDYYSALVPSGSWSGDMQSMYEESVLYDWKYKTKYSISSRVTDDLISGDKKWTLINGKWIEVTENWDKNLQRWVTTHRDTGITEEELKEE